MLRRGKVVAKNGQRVAILTQRGHTIVDLGDAGLGDELTWTVDTTGQQAYMNVTQDRVLMVDVLNHRVSEQQLESAMGLF